MHFHEVSGNVGCRRGGERDLGSTPWSGAGAPAFLEESEAAEAEAVGEVLKGLL